MTLGFLRPLALGAAAVFALPAAHAQDCVSGQTAGLLTPANLTAVPAAVPSVDSAEPIGFAMTVPCTGELTGLTILARSNSNVPARVAFYIARTSTYSIASGPGGVVGLAINGSSGEFVPVTASDLSPVSLSVTRLGDTEGIEPLAVMAGETLFFTVIGGVGFGSGQSNLEVGVGEGAGFTTGIVTETQIGTQLITSEPSDTQAFAYVAAFGEGAGEATDLVTGALGYGTCDSVLPLGRSACRVQATGTFNGDQGQRYTFFLRVAETGRIAFRGEIKLQAGQTVNQSVKFRTRGADPEAFTLEMVIEEGSVASPSDAAEVLSTLDFTKGLPFLRADEALTVFPNPATDAATLRFAVAEQTEATLAVYDALGREVARLVDESVEGVVQASLETSALAPGLYVARLVTEAGTETVRLSVVR